MSVQLEKKIETICCPLNEDWIHGQYACVFNGIVKP